LTGFCFRSTMRVLLMVAIGLSGISVSGLSQLPAHWITRGARQLPQQATPLSSMTALTLRWGCE
jgi:hypothetical protein